jgi:hypothetical protein
MRTRNVLRSLLLPCRALTWNALIAFCTMLLAGPAFAQRNSEAGPPVDRLGASAETVAANADGGVSASSSQQNQPPTSLPNAPSASSDAGPLSLGDRFRIYSRSIVSPYGVVGPALGAGIGQWENEPPEWKQGAEGYARRFGSGMGRHFIAETIRFGVAAADSEDPRYQRSDETGVWNRTRHTIVETFTSKTSSGARIPAFSRFAGIYGAAFISNTWYPDSRATTGYALRRGSTALGASLGFHLFEEFMPRRYFKPLHMPN